LASITFPENAMKVQHSKIASLTLGALVALAATACSTTNPSAGAGASNDDAISTTVAPTGTHRGLGRTAEDEQITARIKAAYAADSSVKADGINIDVMRGMVTLSGTVASPAERDKAVQIANKTSGVFEVKDRLKVAGM
jgi:hyperosmotically inducible protein